MEVRGTLTYLSVWAENAWYSHHWGHTSSQMRWGSRYGCTGQHWHYQHVKKPSDQGHSIQLLINSKIQSAKFKNLDLSKQPAYAHQ